MNRKHGLWLVTFGAAALASVGLFVNCGGKLPGALSQGMADACPVDVADISGIANAQLGLQGELEGKAKAALGAGAELQALANQFEADVAAACGGLATDLGGSVPAAPSGPGKSAQVACKAAVEAFEHLKVSAKGHLRIVAEPPVCEASLDAMADCAAHCDATVQPGAVDVQCEGGKLSGTCGGQCSGTCSVEGSAHCEGKCSGKCEGKCSGQLSGKCEGKCNGKCDGRDSNGAACAGTCDGTCSAKAEASCDGTCEGSCDASCEVKASGQCQGTCTGECSVAFKAPKCSGEVKPPKMSAECQSKCNAQVNGRVTCSRPRVRVELDGAVDAKAAAKLRAALEKNLPVLLSLTVGMKDRLARVSADVKASLEGARAVVSSGGGAALRVGACFASSLEAQARAAVQIDVSIEASASASGSIKGGT